LAVNIGPGERVAGIEVLDASEVLEGLRDGMGELVYLAVA
jgi:hypothetical protein